MIHRNSILFAQMCFLVYLAVFPGSTATVALDRVPDWGIWMGSALLLVQGAAVAGWLVGMYSGRGAIAALVVFGLGWGIEQLGVGSGFPFGPYHYTGVLQPILPGDVPFAIPCAWLMAVLGAWQAAALLWPSEQPTLASTFGRYLLTATLVLLLDLQIETVATLINNYWEWHVAGWYYGVPTANFVAWWVVGLVMAMVIGVALAHSARPAYPVVASAPFARWLQTVTPLLPLMLYLLSTLMFTVVNFAHGYSLAGIVGALVLLGALLTYRGRVSGRTGG
jgi:putative membrane protein